MSATVHRWRRGMLEVAGEFYMPVATVARDPQLLEQAKKALKRDIHNALDGLVAIFGEDQILALCLEVIREGDRPNEMFGEDDEVKD